MIIDFNAIKPVQFQDFNFARPNQSNTHDFDIVIDGEINSNNYCLALFRRIMSIGLSGVVDFLDYQCENLKSPISWLNSTEKLIRFNQVWFNDDDQKFRQIKWTSEIVSKRHDLKVASIQHAREHKLHHSVNGYAGDKVYSFEEVLGKIGTMEVAEEKILYLKSQIKEYHQNPPEFESNLKPKFDKQCQLEIDSIIEEEELLRKFHEKKSRLKRLVDFAPKGQIHCNTNAFIDIMYQLSNEIRVDGEPLLEISTSDLADIICQHFRDKDGNQIPRSTVLTVLDPNRPEKRPKGNRRYKINNNLD